MRIAAVGRALPPNFYTQKQLLAGLRAMWAEHSADLDRLETLHERARVEGRHLALPLAEYAELKSFSQANDRFIACATDLGSRATSDALRQAGIAPGEVNHVLFVSVTGIATPSVDVRISNRLRLSPHIKRTPVFGLGCVAGAAGLARAADYLRGAPDEVALLVSVELCSLTLQRQDFSMANLIASGLFGDGAAAVVLTGRGRPTDGPEIIATRSVLYPDTEEVMGWRIGSGGFEVVLSPDVPRVVAAHLRGDVDTFLAAHGLSRRDIESYVCHPGGPKVLEAVEGALELPGKALELSWRSLQRIGNLSSASVLMVLKDTIEERRPPRGSLGLLLGMGPGFCAELLLLRW
jgi:alkylresorcinol/alkylpyrone synthase